jgi:hypothetical protein
MTKGMAPEGVAAQQHDVRQQHQRAKSYPKLAVEPQRIPHVTRQKHQKQQGQIQKIPVNILDD